VSGLSGGLRTVRDESATLIAVVVAAAAGVAIVLLARWGPDWPAQEFRAWIAAHDGMTMWTSRWYAGSALPGYSVLYPPIAAVLGAGATGLLSTIAAAWAAAGFAPAGRLRGRLFGLAVAACLAQNLLIGQVPFLLGTAFALMAVRALTTRRHGLIVFALALLCSLASPLAGMFVLLIAPAVAVTAGWRRVLPLLGAMGGPAVSLVLGGAGGPFPFPWLSFVGVVLFTVALLLFAPRGSRALRIFAACYLLVAVVAFLVPNPIGGNMGRLGKLVAVPIACHLLVATGLWTRLRAGMLLVAAALWPSVPFVTSMTEGASDPSQYAAFYAGLNRFLGTQNASVGRLEIPFTREHWETLWVARQFPIARGWERQTDLRYNSVLYHPLTPSAYRLWLRRNAVSLVALPHAPFDDGGKAEAALLVRPPPYLIQVWRDSDWTVWRVRGAQPLVGRPARLTDFDQSALTLRFSHAGSAVVRIRGSALWHVTAGNACADTTRAGWLRVRATGPGPVRVVATLNAQLIGGAESC
jgi:hypothetical protein